MNSSTTLLKHVLVELNVMKMALHSCQHTPQQRLCKKSSPYGGRSCPPCVPSGAGASPRAKRPRAHSKGAAAPAAIQGTCPRSKPRLGSTASIAKRRLAAVSSSCASSMLMVCTLFGRRNRGWSTGPRLRGPTGRRIARTHRSRRPIRCTRRHVPGSG